MPCIVSKPISFFVSPLYVRESDKAFRFKAKELKLRDFQLRLYERLANYNTPEIIRVYASTGAGKTLSLLIPLFVNIERGWVYNGSVGVYPSRELAEDQMATLYNLLVELGAEPRDVGELFPELGKLAEDEKLELSEFMKLLEVEVEGGPRVLVLLILVTSTTLESLRRILEKQEDSPESRRELLRRISSQSIRGVYRVVFTVPEYPYLLSTAVYREFEEAGTQLLVVLRELARFLKALESGNEEPLEMWLRELAASIDRRRMARWYGVSREFLKSVAETFLLFRAPVFFDEFHLYSGFSLASFISLLYVYMLEGDRKVIISSATPSKPIRVGGRGKDLSELVGELAAALGYGVCDIGAEVSSSPGEGWVQIRKRTEVKIVPVVIPSDAVGAAAYGQLQRCLDSVLEVSGWLEDYKSKQRSMILVDRVAAVLQIADAVHKLTGEQPLRVCSIKRLFQDSGESGKPSLKEAKLVVGNMAVAFGIDIGGMDLGVVVAKDHLTALQKIGRIGRGSGGDCAVVYLPIPIYKFQEVSSVLEKISGREVPYISTGRELDFVRLLRKLYPSESPDVLVRSGVGVFKAVFPMWVYTLATVMRLRSEVREDLYVARKLEDVEYLRWFALALRVLGEFFEIDRLEHKLRAFIKKQLYLTPLALYNLYSYRNMAGVAVKRRRPDDTVVEEVVDLVTAGRNIPLTYRNGEFWVDEGCPPYMYSRLGLRVDSEYAGRVVEVLEKLDGKMVTFGLFIELVEDIRLLGGMASRAELFQLRPRGVDRVAGLSHLRDSRAIRELPVLVLRTRDKKTAEFIEYLSATESVIPVYASKGEGLELLGGIYML